MPSLFRHQYDCECTLCDIQEGIDLYHSMVDAGCNFANIKSYVEEKGIKLDTHGDIVFPKPVISHEESKHIWAKYYEEYYNNCDENCNCRMCNKIRAWEQPKELKKGANNARSCFVAPEMVPNRVALFDQE